MTTLIVNTIGELRRRVVGATAPGLAGSEHYERADELLGQAAEALEEGHRARREALPDLTAEETELRGEMIRAEVQLARRRAHLTLVA